RDGGVDLGLILLEHAADDRADWPGDYCAAEDSGQGGPTALVSAGLDFNVCSDDRLLDWLDLALRDVLVDTLGERMRTVGGELCCVLLPATEPAGLLAFLGQSVSSLT